jgi:hypothetical protein
MSNKRKTATHAADGELPDTATNPPQPSVARNEAHPPAQAPGSGIEPDPCFCPMHKFLHVWFTRCLLCDQTDNIVIALMMELVWASRDGAVGLVLDDSFLTVRFAGQNVVRTALDRLAAAGLVRVLRTPSNHPITLVELLWSGGDEEDGYGVNDETA